VCSTKTLSCKRIEQWDLIEIVVKSTKFWGGEWDESLIRGYWAQFSYTIMMNALICLVWNQQEILFGEWMKHHTNFVKTIIMFIVLTPLWTLWSTCEC
jgi:hypothetical protein